MNNKRLGTLFEREFCALLAARGYWVHFITPAANGTQPFDVIAVKDGKAYAYDCKTSTLRHFTMARLEQNQITSFEKWMTCGNGVPRVAVKYMGSVYIVNYKVLKEKGIVDLLEESVCLD